MKKRNLLIISIIVLVIIIAIFYFFATGSYYNLKMEKKISTFPTYYQELAEKCKNDRCCLSSVEGMAINNYRVATSETLVEGECPEGTTLNGLLCPTSYSWCE